MEALSFFCQIPYLNLVDRPTPVHLLAGVEELFGGVAGVRVFVKREDATDLVYGGNKVRNLEFILADAMTKGAEKIVTLAPVGSNFVAALAVQTKRLGMPTEVF